MAKNTTFEDARDVVLNFIKSREWDKNNTPRGLAISLSLEANELLEHFQWSDESIGDKEELASELADIIIYSIQFANKFNIDIPAAVIKKIEKQNKKYPVEITKITDRKKRDAAWLEAKKKYKKDTTL